MPTHAQRLMKKISNVNADATSHCGYSVQCVNRATFSLLQNKPWVKGKKINLNKWHPSLSCCAAPAVQTFTKLRCEVVVGGLYAGSFGLLPQELRECSCGQPTKPDWLATLSLLFFQTWDLVYGARTGVTSNLKGNTSWIQDYTNPVHTQK